jgi:predicted AlkP superfamily pyrophosphatase or phosphodiesterase
MSQFPALSRTPVVLAALLACAPLSGCVPGASVIRSGPQPAAYASTIAAAPLPGTLSEHVVVISIDGLRPDAIERFGAGTLQRLMREGSYSLRARTILPSITLPSHTSMLTGEEPETHGITWNDNRTETEGTVGTPTVFSLAHVEGLHTAAFFSKGKFHHLLIPGSVNFAVAPEGNGKWLAGRTAAHVEDYLEEARPNLLFVHLGDADYAGHTVGWMSWVYGWAVRHADGAVARVLAAADRAYGEGNYTVLVTADHGGHDRTHGSDDARDVTIPWIAWGKGIRAGGAELPAGIHTTDTAATALRLLGVEEHVSGEAVTGALDPARVAATR